MAKIRKIAILTSGGDAPGMNSFIRAAARTAIANGIQVVGIEEGYAGLLAGKFRDLSHPTSVSNILTEAGTALYSARCDEFKEPEYQRLAAYICRANNIDGIIVCGGDGTFQGATKLSALGIPTVAVPGTIDADVTSTDYTIGFDTAMNTVVEMADSLRATCESHARCNVIEVMGRNAGHIAVRTGIAVGASAVAIPEVPFDEAEAIEKIKTQRLNGKRGIIVVVSEGLPGYAEKLAKTIEKETGIITRFCVLAHVQQQQKDLSQANPTSLSAKTTAKSAISTLWTRSRSTSFIKASLQKKKSLLSPQKRKRGWTKDAQRSKLAQKNITDSQTSSDKNTKNPALAAGFFV